MKSADTSFAAIAAAAMLASCGGGGSPTPTATATPTPTATATPTPTPTPTPTFSYETFEELTGDQDFPTACVEFGAGGQGTLNGFLSGSFADPGQIDYTASSDSWTVQDVTNTFEQVFTPADITAQFAHATVYEVTTVGQTRMLQLVTPMVNNAPGTYSRGAIYLVGENGICSYGVATDSDDVPATPTVTYDQVNIGGTFVEKNAATGAVVTGAVIGGSGTITGDTVTGDVSISIFVTRRDPSGAEITIGPINFPAFPEVGNGRAGYRASYDPSGVYGITLSGGFYGPQGIETGFALVMTEDLTNNGEPDRSYILNGLATR